MKMRVWVWVRVRVNVLDGVRFRVLGDLRVELEHSPRSAAETLIERLEEAMEAEARLLVLPVGVAEPLHGGDGDGAVEHALPEGHSQPHVLTAEEARGSELNLMPGVGAGRNAVSRQLRGALLILTIQIIPQLYMWQPDGYNKHPGTYADAMTDESTIIQPSQQHM